MKRPLAPWLDNIVYRLIDSGVRLLGLMPLSWAWRLGRWIGPLLYRLDRRHREIAHGNLVRAFGREKPAPEIRRIARQVFVNLASLVFEIAWSLRLDKKTMARRFRVEGMTRFTNAYRRGKGVLLFTAHAGNWELMPVFPGLYGYRVNVLYRPLDFKPLDRFFLRIRSRFGARMISTARSARQVIGALRRGESVALLMDQNVDWYEGVFVDFFGRRACTNKGLALIALKTGAPVVPVFMVRDRDGFRAVIGEEVPLIRTGDKTRDIEENTARYNRVIEAFVRRYPDQWFWVHQRWKTRPYQPWPRNGGPR